MGKITFLKRQNENQLLISQYLTRLKRKTSFGRVKMKMDRNLMLINIKYNTLYRNFYCQNSRNVMAGTQFARNKIRHK